MRVMRLAAIGIIVLLIGYFLGQTVQASSFVPGSETDPLVTKSYVDDRLSKLTAQVVQLSKEVELLKRGNGGPQQSDQAPIKLVINDKNAYVGDRLHKLEVAPFVEQGWTMVPFRFIGEALGAQISWDQKTQTVGYVLDGTRLELRIGSLVAVHNGQQRTLEVAPRLIGGTTVVPLRVVSENLGAQVLWDQAQNTVIILP